MAQPYAATLRAPSGQEKCAIAADHVDDDCSVPEIVRSRLVRARSSYDGYGVRGPAERSSAGRYGGETPTNADAARRTQRRTPGDSQDAFLLVGRAPRREVVGRVRNGNQRRKRRGTYEPVLDRRPPHGVRALPLRAQHLRRTANLRPFVPAPGDRTQQRRGRVRTRPPVRAA